MREREKGIVFVAVVTSFITTFTSSALNLSVPDIGTEFDISAVLIGWVVTGFILTSASFSVPLGRLADLTGRKRILIGGIGLFSLCSLGCAFSWSFFSLMIFRLLQGFGAAMIFSTNIAILVNAFPPEERGRAIGMSTAATYIGLSTGPVLGGVLNHQFGWHSIFIATAAIGFIAFVAAVKILPENQRKEDIRPEDRDLTGNILYVLTLILLLYGFSSFSEGLYAYLFVLIGAVLLVLFIRHEFKALSPVLQISLFRENPAYLLSIYLQVIQGFDSQTAGLILICQPAVMALISPYTGRLSDRKSPFVLASLGMGFSALGLFGFSFLCEQTPLWMLICGLIVVGVGFGFFSSPNSNAIMSCVEKKDSGVASSLLATMRTVGQTSSMAMVTFIASFELGDHTFETATPQSLIEMMHIAFFVFGLICTAGVFISLKRKRA